MQQELPDHIGLKDETRNSGLSQGLLPVTNHRNGSVPMRRLKIASLAILGAAAIFAFGPAMAKETMAKGKMTKGEITKSETTKAEVTKGGSKTLAKGQRHMQRHVAYRGERFRNANAAMTRQDQVGRPLGPVGTAGAVVGGVAATAGAIATAPFRAFDNSYNNYYGYGYGGRDWKTYAAHNGLACAPGTTFKGADGKLHRCQ
jgi:hypothetical protein